MNVIRYLERLKSAEGLRLKPYLDHLGIPTIGYGTTHWEGAWVTMYWTEITLQKATFMLQAEAMSTIVEASKSVANFDDLCNVRQECLSEMAYQLGGTGLRNFKKMIAGIEELDWYTAHDEVWDSKMGRDPQLQKRVGRYSQMLLMGESYGY